MPSIKPKIQGYVEPELFSVFEQWRIEQGKGISEALNDLLKEFFGFKISPSGGLRQEDVEDLIEKKIIGVEQKIQHLENERLQKLVEGALVAYSMPLLLRLEAVEQIIKPIEGLAEISHPLPESVGDSLQSPLEELEKESEPSSLEVEDAQANSLPEISLQSPSYSADNYPRRGDRFCTSHGKEGEIIKIWPENPKYEIQWDGLALPKRHDLADLQVMGACRIPSPIPLEGLKQAELEKRLGIAKGTLTKRRGRPDFKEWSQGHDPDGIAWTWDAIARKYLAVE